MTDGKALTAENLKNGDKVVIISKDVADANNLRVGDMVSLSYVAAQGFEAPGAGGRNGGATAATTTAKAVDYEVIGIYEATSTTSTASTFDVNTMFTSNTVIYDLNGTTGKDETSGSVVYLLDNPEHVAAFIKEQSPNLTSEYHSLYSNDDEYNSLTKPLNLISFITAILIWVVFIAGAAIILAVATIFVRDRKFEIGLLLSSGEGKMKIITQFIFEMMLIAIVAFGISVASSNVASKSVSTWIVNNQLLSQTSLIRQHQFDDDIAGRNTEFPRSRTDFGCGFGLWFRRYAESGQPVQCRSQLPGGDEPAHGKRIAGADRIMHPVDRDHGVQSETDTAGLLRRMEETK